MLLAGTLMGLVRRGRGKVMLETTEQDYIILLALLALDLEGFFLGGPEDIRLQGGLRCVQVR